MVERGEAAAAAATGAEKTRLEGLLVTRRKLLNQQLIQETMYNRFDPIIAMEVEAANKAHGLTGTDALDPDLVKAMLFQESELGTSGTHLEVPPSHPVKTRFNLGEEKPGHTWLETIKAYNGSGARAEHYRDAIANRASGAATAAAAGTPFTPTR